MAQTHVVEIAPDVLLSDDEADALIAAFIRPDEDFGRHEARVATEHRSVNVWRVLRWLRASDVAEVADGWGLPEDAVKAVVAYYRRHRDLFDAKLLLEDETSGVR